MAFSWWVTHDNTTVGPLLTTYLFFGNRPAAFMGKIQRAGMSVLSGPVVHGKQQCSISIRDPFNQEPERKKPALLDMASSSISETPSPSSDWCIPWVRDCQWLSNWNILVNFDLNNLKFFKCTLLYIMNIIQLIFESNCFEGSEPLANLPSEFEWCGVGLMRTESPANVSSQW